MHRFLQSRAALLAVALPAALALPVGGADAQTPAAAARRPKLVVHLTVDQLRADYHDRFRGQLTGGLARLYRGGAVFTDAHQDHAITETAPGHASTLSGRFPRGTGITMNALGVQDPQAPLIGGGGPGASPFRFRGSTLVDWLRLQDPRTRALSVARKDRGAILPIGRAPQDVYWYASNGNFTTSTYYRDTLPTWVQQFNARGIPASYAGKLWTPLLADSAYAEADTVPQEARGQGVFPYMVPEDPQLAVGSLPNFPFMDEVTADFALAGVEAMGLGDGPQTDVLAVSFSTTDAVGHQFGPDSKELHDQVLRLDRALGRFLDSLFVLRDSADVVISLTADHGVAPLPGVVSRDPNQGARPVSLRAVLLAADSALQMRGVAPGAIDPDGGAIHVDRAKLAAAGVRADSVIDALVGALGRVPGVQRADRWSALARRDTTRDVVARRWLHMFPADVAPDLVVTLAPYNVWGDAYPGSAQHGAPHAYDTHVPVLFYGAPFKPGRYDQFARVVDIAPTLAAVVGVTPTERLDGRVLTAALRPAATAGATAAPTRRD